jgi:hypothetical protein
LIRTNEVAQGIGLRHWVFASAIILVSGSSWFPADAAPSLPVCPVQDGTVTSYDIVRNGDVIGHHTIGFHLSGGELTVEIVVEASLFFLGIRVYHYEHKATEVWRAGQMVAMRTRTRDDGTAHNIDASLDTATGRWTGLAGPLDVSGPLLASSLWNSGTVQEVRLVDHETGEVSPVHIVAGGQDGLMLNGRRIIARRYDMSGSTSGSVWYDDRGCWVRALFKSPVDGSQIDVRVH